MDVCKCRLNKFPLLCALISRLDKFLEAVCTGHIWFLNTVLSSLENHFNTTFKHSTLLTALSGELTFTSVIEQERKKYFVSGFIYFTIAILHNGKCHGLMNLNVTML